MIGKMKEKVKAINEKGETSASRIVEIAIGIFVAAAILPDAISNWFNVSKTGWTTATSTLWDLAPVLIVAGVVLAYYKYTKRQ